MIKSHPHWPDWVLEGLGAAKQAQAHSHSPYSNYPVGAALKIKESDEWILGCNVENSSFGGTICAERSALCAARSQFGAFTPVALVLITPVPAKTGSPCGLCLQSLTEFCLGEFPICLSNPDGPQQIVQLKDLLPRPFQALDLHK